MVFYINDPKGYSYPYKGEHAWRSIEPKAPAEKTKSFHDRFKEQASSKARKDTIEKTIVQDEKWQQKESYHTDMPLLAQQIMSHPVICRSPEDSLEEAWKIICGRRFRHLPIVNKEGKLIGVISDRRLTRSMINKEAGVEEDPQSIGDIMVSPVLTARPYTSVSDIAKKFVGERIGCMPVLDDHGNIVGIITRSDILRTVIKVTPFELRG